MIFVDTDLIIGLSRGDPRAVELLHDLAADEGGLATTSLNVAEFLRGNPPAAARRLISEAFREVPFGPRAARRFATIASALDRAGKRMPTVDACIAAVVVEEKGRLATGNVQDFAAVPGLLVVSPKRPPAP